LTTVDTPPGRFVAGLRPPQPNSPKLGHASLGLSAQPEAN